MQMTLAGTNVVRVKDNFLPAVGSPKSTYGVRSQVFDALIALGSTFLSISILLSFLDSLSGLWRPLVFLLVLVHNLSLFWRRRTPWTSYTINLVSGVALAATRDDMTPDGRAVALEGALAETRLDRR